jgi:hypothetical protein
VLLQLACDWLRAERIVRPPVDALARRVATARDAARAETYHRLDPLLTPPIQRQLDGLLDVDPDLGITRLAWLRRGATAVTPEALKVELGKLEFLRRHGADAMNLSRLPVGRRRMLAEIGRPSTNQALKRADVDRRYPVLLATLVETYVEVLDELVQLLDQALAGADSRARHELSQRLVDRAKAEADRARLLDEILDVLADPNVADAEAGRLVRQRIGMQRLIAAPALVRTVTTLLGCSYTSRQATYVLRRLKRKGLIARLPGHHRYQLTPLGRRVAVLFTKVYGRVLAPGLAELDPRLPTDLAHRSELSHAWRQLDQRLNQFANAALTAA